MTYMKMLELLIPSVIRELFVSNDNASKALAMALSSADQRHVLLSWYMTDQPRAKMYKIPWIRASYGINASEAEKYFEKDLLPSIKQKLENELL